MERKQIATPLPVPFKFIVTGSSPSAYFATILFPDGAVRKAVIPVRPLHLRVSDWTQLGSIAVSDSTPVLQRVPPKEPQRIEHDSEFSSLETATGPTFLALMHRLNEANLAVSDFVRNHAVSQSGKVCQAVYKSLIAQLTAIRPEDSAKRQFILERLVFLATWSASQSVPDHVGQCALKHVVEVMPDRLKSLKVPHQFIPLLSPSHELYDIVQLFFRNVFSPPSIAQCLWRFLEPQAVVEEQQRAICASWKVSRLPSTLVNFALMLNLRCLREVEQPMGKSQRASVDNRTISAIESFLERHPTPRGSESIKHDNSSHASGRSIDITTRCTSVSNC